MGNTPKVLIVEDERIIALDLRRRIEKFGYEVCAVVSSAEEAVRATEEHDPDIVLMDIMLSGERDGTDAAVELRDRFGTPVVFLTAYADEQTLKRAKRAEPVGYVLKPFKERELYTTIEIALYKSRVDKELLRQERLFNAILSSIGEAIVSADAEGRITFLNPVAEELTGWQEAEARGVPLDDVIQLLDHTTEERLALPLEEIHRDSFYEFDELYLLTKLGGHVNVSGRLAAINQPGGSQEGYLVALRDVTAYHRMSEIIDYQARHDSLTGLMNRKAFFGHLHELAAESVSEATHHTFLYVDLDQFKIVNDIAGHRAGDELLRQVSRDLVGALGDRGMVARLGGDEFGAVILNTPVEEGLEFARNIQEVLNRRFIWQQKAFQVTTTIGLVPVGGNNTDGYSILAAADDANYLAKESGGNTVKLYETADYHFLKRRGEMQWISRLTHALERDQFVLYGQPIAENNAARKIDKIEILLRLRDQEGTLISPADFIPAAEKYNLMPAIDRWVIRRVLQLLSARESGGPRHRVAINLSGSSVADESLLDFIIEEINESGADPSLITLEVTETAAIENLTRATSFISRLKEVGISFALDDFGNGFSSFAYLKTLPVDYLKIDGSFVKDMTEDPIDYALVEAVNNIGHTMGLKTIAEYVKDAETLEALGRLGVDYVQGFELYKPAPLEEFILLKE
ncbi:MAG: putative bifunctional diguanylate cyclase/phosphodiesterase [Alkalispirochaetaceae bacterium]